MITTREPMTGSGGASDSPPERGAGKDTTWWRRPWVVPLAFVAIAFIAIAFIAFSLPPYLELEPGQSRVPPSPAFGWYYPLLVTHIGFASVAMLTCMLQVWPWFRQRFPVAHRRLGCVYVFGGALPAGSAGLVLAPVTPFGPVAAVSNTLMATLWFAPQLDTTFGGNEQLFVHAVAGVTTWTGWVIPLLISQWWLEHRRHTVRPETSNRVSIAAT